MLKSSSWPRMLAASLTFATLLGSVAWAQQPPMVRIRGTIEAVDGPMLPADSVRLLLYVDSRQLWCLVFRRNRLLQR